MSYRIARNPQTGETRIYEWNLPRDPLPFEVEQAIQRAYEPPPGTQPPRGMEPLNVSGQRQPPTAWMPSQPPLTTPQRRAAAGITDEMFPLPPTGREIPRDPRTATATYRGDPLPQPTTMGMRMQGGIPSGLAAVREFLDRPALSEEQQSELIGDPRTSGRSMMDILGQGAMNEAAMQGSMTPGQALSAVAPGVRGALGIVANAPFALSGTSRVLDEGRPPFERVMGGVEALSGLVGTGLGLADVRNAIRSTPKPTPPTLGPPVAPATRANWRRTIPQERRGLSGYTPPPPPAAGAAAPVIPPPAPVTPPAQVVGRTIRATTEAPPVAPLSKEELAFQNDLAKVLGQSLNQQPNRTAAAITQAAKDRAAATELVRKTQQAAQAAAAKEAAAATRAKRVTDLATELKQDEDLAKQVAGDVRVASLADRGVKVSEMEDLASRAIVEAPAAPVRPIPTPRAAELSQPSRLDELLAERGIGPDDPMPEHMRKAVQLGEPVAPDPLRVQPAAPPAPARPVVAPPTLAKAKPSKKAKFDQAVEGVLEQTPAPVAPTPVKAPAATAAAPPVATPTQGLAAVLKQHDVAPGTVPGSKANLLRPDKSNLDLATEVAQEQIGPGARVTALKQIPKPSGKSEAARSLRQRGNVVDKDKRPPLVQRLKDETGAVGNIKGVPTIKKSKDFAMDGNWRVTFPDGRKYDIYRDTSSGMGQWEVDGLASGAGTTAFTKKELIDKLADLDESKPFIDIRTGINRGSIADTMKVVRSRMTDDQGAIDPRLLALPLTNPYARAGIGSAIGYNVAPEDEKVTGAMVGAIGAGMLKPGQWVPHQNRLMMESMLAGPASIATNPAGNIGTGLITPLLLASRGHVDDAYNLAASYTRPSTWRAGLRGLKEGWNRVDNETMGVERPSDMGGLPPGPVGRTLNAADQATVNVFEQGGIPEDVARQYIFSADPVTQWGKGVAMLQQLRGGPQSSLLGGAAGGAVGAYTTPEGENPFGRGLKGALTGQIIGAAGGTALTPFIRTATKMGELGAAHSPLRLMSPALQKAFPVAGGEGLSNPRVWSAMVPSTAAAGLGYLGFGPSNPQASALSGGLQTPYATLRQAHDAEQYGDTGIRDLFRALGRQLPLHADVQRLAEDPERLPGQLVERFIPPALLMLGDKTIRDPRGTDALDLEGYLRERIPGLRETLPARPNFLGETEERNFIGGVPAPLFERSPIAARLAEMGLLNREQSGNFGSENENFEEAIAALPEPAQSAMRMLIQRNQLSPEQRNLLKQLRGQRMTQMLEPVLDNPALLSDVDDPTATTVKDLIRTLQRRGIQAGTNEFRARMLQEILAGGQ